MRRNLEYSENEITSLEEELAAAREYLTLQQMRFPSRMQYRIDAAPETVATMVPSRILQPVVENCIKHAVESCSAVTEIRIASERNINHLLITVENTRDGESAHRGFGSGLKLVEKRLEILYGHDASLRAGPVGSGYRVQMTLPVLRSSNGSGQANKQ
jgi:two-component system sensor histidine kinase AlgZ